jgi:2-polyprenyl-3-methyl-5-hydroxy-6-metoxy-1,4-benzoquinol methylase
MEKYGENINTLDLWGDVEKTENYIKNLENSYHKHRLDVINDLIPEDLYKKDKKIFDFGCGNAVLFRTFLENEVLITGVDISQEMINDAEIYLESMGYDKNVAQLGGVEKFKSISDSSLDAVFSFNVLAYLNNSEEISFYKEAARVIKPGGYLVVTHSNELFDMFTLNRFTIDFFRNNFNLVEEELKELEKILEKTKDVPENKITYNIRENPLNYSIKLKKYGFKEERIEFINFHEVPPVISEKANGYLDTLEIKEIDKWKLNFQCSTFGSLSIRI